MDQPSAIELVTAVREFIEKHALPELAGRTAFHARVAANALAIVARELENSEQANAEERSRLEQLLHKKGDLHALNRELCRKLRANEIAFDDPEVRRHLCLSTLAKVAIDQPSYSGLVHSPHLASE